METDTTPSHVEETKTTDPLALVPLIEDTTTGIQYDPISRQVADDSGCIGWLEGNHFTPDSPDPIHLDALQAICRLIVMARKPEILGTLAPEVEADDTTETATHP